MAVHTHTGTQDGRWQTYIEGQEGSGHSAPGSQHPSCSVLSRPPPCLACSSNLYCFVHVVNVVNPGVEKVVMGHFPLYATTHKHGQTEKLIAVLLRAVCPTLLFRGD